MDTALNQDESELAVLVFPITLKMFANGDSLVN